MTLYDHEEMARAEGLQQGIQQGMLTSQAKTIDALMQNLGWSIEEACKAINISVEDYNAAKQAVNDATYPAEIKSEGDNIVSEATL